jgi:hypothetical protein
MTRPRPSGTGTGDKMNTTVAIVGSHPATRNLFDFDRKDCEVWLFNEALADPMGWAKRADAVFQMHAPEIWKSPANRNDPKHYDWLKSGNTPKIYMREKYAEIPNAERYPLEELQATLLLNFNHARYFTSSVSYAIALAIYKGYERIELYGVEMETNTEYMYQRDCVAFWTGLAIGRGIDVYAPIRMFETPYLYGYEGGANLDISIYKNRVDELAPIAESIKGRYIEARALVDEMLREWDGGNDSGQKIVQAVMALSRLANEFGLADGTIQEAERYLAKCNTMLLVADAYLISRQEYEAAHVNHGRAASEKNNEAVGHAAEMESIMNNAAKLMSRKARVKAMNKFPAAMDKFIRACTAIGLHNGASYENRSYLAQLDDMTRAAGSAKSEAILTDMIKERIANVAAI